jgi:PadR family transcriptional regulator, regulatory protein AphA
MKEVRMSLRFALLGLLSDQSMSGYDLTKRFEDSLNNVWPARHSQIYPELNRLNDEGLIEIVAEGPRGRKEYRSTQAGREAVREWLTTSDPEWGIRSEPMLRAFFLWLLEPEKARAYLIDYRTWFEERLKAYREIKTYWTPQTEGEKAAWVVLEAGVVQAEAAIKWADWAMEQYGGRNDESRESSTPAPS